MTDTETDQNAAAEADSLRVLRYLQVQAEISDSAADAKAFQGYMKKLMPTFTATPPGWVLYLSFTRQDGVDASSLPATGKNYRFMNFWQVSDYNSLPWLMAEFEDSETYLQLDKLVQVETQDFFGGLSFNPANNPYFKPPKAQHYFHMTCNMGTDPTALVNFESFMIEVSADPNGYMLANGWTLVGATYSQTGRLRQYSLTWSTNKGTPDAQGAADWLLSQPQMQAALNKDCSPSTVWEIWQPIDYGK